MAKKKDKAKNKAEKHVLPTELQTDGAKITATGRVISDHPSNSITPATLKSMFDDAESGNITAQHELFMDVEERDSAIGSAFGTRKRAILTLDYRVAEPRNATPQEVKLTEEADDLIKGLDEFEDLLIDMMDAVGHGFSAIEVEWELINGLQYPVSFTHRPQTWFLWDKDDNLMLKTPSNQQGEALWPLGWVVHTHKNRSVQAARNGLFRTLAWLYMFKHYSLHDFAEFLELYGLPIRIGKYGAGATDKEKATLLRAVAEIGHNAAGIMPDGMSIEITQATSSGTNDPFMRMIEWCEKSAARLILGQTLTSGADGNASTNALGKIHNEVRRDLLVSDAKQLAQTITKQIIQVFLQINFPNVDPRRLPSFEFDTREIADLGTFAEALPKLVQIGVSIPEPWAREKLAIPDAQDGEDLLAMVQPPALQAALSAQGCTCCNGTAHRKAALSANVETNDEQQLLDGAIDEALQSPDFNAQLNPMVKQAVAALMNCDSYEEASAALTALYPKLDNSQFQTYMQQALYLTDLLGQANGQA